MKKFTLTFAVLCAFCASAYTGTERYSGSKEVIQQAPPSCEWYRGHEWDFDFWGAYALSGNPGRFNVHEDPFALTPDAGPPEAFSERGSRENLGEVTKDRLIGRDNTQAGGADVKFFFSKYWALGIEGFVLAAKTNTAGAALGTFTFRFPIGCSRFAPYMWGGAGGLWGGGGLDRFFIEKPNPGPNAPDREREYFTTTPVENKHGRFDGQVGAGIEVRLTRHIGLMSDFCWNFIAGKDTTTERSASASSNNSDGQDFGMVRGGVTLSY